MAELGQRSTDDWADGERPKSWRESIVYLFPNGDSPLTALLSRMPPVATTDPEHSWWDKTLAPGEVVVASISANIITLDENAKLLPKGTLLFNNSTSQTYRVASDPDSETAVTIEANCLETPTTARTTVAADHVLTIVGSAQKEGDGVPTAVGTNPVKRKNYTQIVRTSLSMTRTAMMTNLRTGEAYRNAQIEALQLHSKAMEMASLSRTPATELASGGDPIRTMAGIQRMLIAWAPDNNVSGATFTEAKVQEWISNAFVFGRDPKLMFVGVHGELQFIRLGNAGPGGKGQFNYESGDTVWGVKMQEFKGSGTCKMVKHPLFFHHKTFLDKVSLILDLSQIKYATLRGKDVVFVKHRQSPGADGRIDEFLVEMTMEMHHAVTHYRIYSLGDFA